MNEDKRSRDSNPDPLTGEPGAHPVGVGAGAAAGGATGAAIGAIGGPIGVAVGAAVGAVAGGLAGKGVAEAIDPTAEDAYWRANHGQQPYAKDRSYDDYAPAYRTGYEGAGRHYAPGTRFEDAESKLRQDYETNAPGTVAGAAGSAATKAHLAWDEAKHATKAAWHRVTNDRPTS